MISIGVYELIPYYIIAMKRDYPRPTAIFSANNEMAFGVYLGLQELGIPLDSIEDFGSAFKYLFFKQRERFFTWERRKKPSMM